MPLYCVSYDIHTGISEDYSALIDHLKSYSRWWHYLESTWFIYSDDSARNVLRRARALVPEAISIMVFEPGPTWAAAGFEQKAYDWIRKNWRQDAD